MIVKVFIKRQIREGNDMEVLGLLKKLRSRAMDKDGYISGETFVKTDNPLQIMVVSTWDSLESWDEWEKSEDRKEIDARLNELQTGAAEYESYVFSKYRLSVKEGFPEKKL